MSPPTPKLRISSDVLYTQVGNGIVVLDLKTRRFYDLDTTGARIWSLLMQDKDPEQIADQLEAEYDADRCSIASDINTLIDNLCDLGLLQRVNLGDHEPLTTTFS
jgi:hypothetical protein